MASCEYRLKRIYEPAAGSDGFRVLVDRVWPRGVTKAEARLDLWLKEVAPSAGLRKWFGHDLERWRQFTERYRAELDENKATVAQLLDLAGKHGKMTLLFGAKDTEHNQAVVLRDYLQEQRR